MHLSLSEEYPNPGATTAEDGDDGAATAATAAAQSFTFDGYVSNANYSSKKGVYILFINNRLVDCASIKKVVDQVYSDILPKNAHPFCYLSLIIPPEHVDVNVHPTKKEVHFLHEDKLLTALHTALHTSLQAANESRTFYTTQVLSASAGNTHTHIEPGSIPMKTDPAPSLTHTLILTPNS